MFYYNTISVVPSFKSLARQWQKALTAYANMCVTKTDTCMPPAFKNSLRTVTKMKKRQRSQTVVSNT